MGKWVMEVSEQRFLHSQFLSGAEREVATTTKQTNNNNKTKRGEWGRVGRVRGAGGGGGSVRATSCGNFERTRRHGHHLWYRLLSVRFTLAGSTC